MVYKRDIGVNINDFLMRYEFLYQKLQKFVQTLFDEVRLFYVKALYTGHVVKALNTE